jgi:hypothetical protein
MKTLKYGIEIETVGLDRASLARAIHAVTGGTLASDYEGSRVTMADGRVWKVVRDGSLSGGERSGEIVSPILTYADLDTLQEIIRSVRAAGAKADPSCGIHVHVDGAGLDARSTTNLVKLVYKQERILENALGISTTRLTQYCRPIEADFVRRLEERKPRTMADVRDAWYGHRNASPSRYHTSRYRGLNLNSLFFRGTVEYRLFNGTLHAGEVKAYVQLVLALTAKAMKARSASSAKRTYDAATAKYDFRVFLLHLGLIGPEFKTARLHLLKRLGGSAAWKGERRDRRSAAPAAPTEGNDAASGAPEAA